MERIYKMYKKFLFLIALPLSFLTSSIYADAGINIVDNGKPNACIILSKQNNWATLEAAKELNYHIQKASGVKLPIYNEDEKIGNKVKIYIGNTLAAQKAGIDVNALQPNQLVVKSTENKIFLIGKDSDYRKEGIKASPFSRERGSLWATYEFLEHYMKVKWLWPGKTGEVIPHMSSISIPENIYINKEAPLISARWGNNPMRRVKNPTQEQQNFIKDEDLWLQRHRHAEVTSPLVMHSFREYYKRFFKQHPEYFQLLPDGRRGLLPGGEKREYQVGLCPSSTALHKRILKDWEEKKCSQIRKRWIRDDDKWVFIGENDTLGFCCCEKCRSWDASDPGFKSDPYWGAKRIPTHSERFNATVHLIGDNKGRPSLSDRYAKFYLAVQDVFNKAGYKDIIVAGFAYANYTKAPKVTKLNKNISITFVPPIDFPFSKEKIDNVKKEWNGWHESGVELMTLRPNYTLSGYNLPISYGKEHCDIVNYAAERGLCATFFDSLVGQYGGQALSLYTVAKLNADPKTKYNDILKDFTDSFVPANEEVGEYLNYWQKFSEKIAVNDKDFAEKRKRNGAYRYWFWLLLADEYFTPPVMQNAQQLLNKAFVKAKGTPAEQRVTFLQQGLEHAILTMETVTAWKIYKKTFSAKDLLTFKKKLKSLYQFRDKIKNTNISNLAILYRWEKWLWGKYTKEFIEG